MDAPDNVGLKPFSNWGNLTYCGHTSINSITPFGPPLCRRNSAFVHTLATVCALILAQSAPQEKTANRLVSAETGGNK